MHYNKKWEIFNDKNLNNEPPYNSAVYTTKHDLTVNQNIFDK